MAGQLRVDEITNEAGTGAPSFPNGIPPASLGTGTPSSANFLRGDGAWQSPAGQLQLLQEDIFTTSGSWTRAAGFDPDDTVMIFLAGGGGSGGAARVNTEHGIATGGAAGSTLVIAVRYNDVPSTAFTLTVGAGGASVAATTTGAVSGLAGGETRLTNGSARCIFVCPITANAFAQTGTSQRLSGGTNGAVGVVFGIGGAQANNNINGFLLSRQASYWNQSSVGASSASELDTSDLWYYAPSPNGVFSSGGTAARVGATNRTSYNAPNAALFTGGGAGSGTTNGANATGMGGGGGGCCLQNVNATSGAGAAGGMIVRYYRGRVSPYQVIGAGGF